MARFLFDWSCFQEGDTCAGDCLVDYPLIDVTSLLTQGGNLPSKDTPRGILVSEVTAAFVGRFG